MTGIISYKNKYIIFSWNIKSFFERKMLAGVIYITDAHVVRIGQSRYLKTHMAQWNLLHLAYDSQYNVVTQH